MHRLSLKLKPEGKRIRPGKLGNCTGTNPWGESYGFTNYYMTKNGQPFIPVMGEFHFSRFSPLHWEEELWKMKAGGISIVATYVFWNHHEEEEGVFDWSGQRNLRHFTDLCAKVRLPLILRIGPFCHGEVRNGGIPDWVFHKPLEVRSNDPQYLALARRLYREIAKQVSGCWFEDGGPIIGVQLENEYMHAGAPLDAWGYKTGVFLSAGKDGKAHLAELRRLAEEAGMKPLFFTATAWGGAAVPDEDTLPMLAGYAYTPWIPNQPPSREYLFRNLHEQPMERVHFDTREYPVAYCEMAGGMQVSYSARPYVPPDSIEAMTVVKLASGSNLLGYYMYHGGSNPKGKHTYLNEYGLPKITYDYQAPLGEFGRVGESYDRIRVLALMLDAFGPLIAPLATELPPGQADLAPGDANSIRWCVRQANGSGFLFLNNFQDHVDMVDHHDVRIELDTGRGIVAFPSNGTFTLKKGVSAVLPFHMDLKGLHLVSATVQPLTKLERGDRSLFVFQALDGLEPELVLDKRTVARIERVHGEIIEEESVWIVKPVPGKEYGMDVLKPDGGIVTIAVFIREEALQTYKLDLWGEERILVSNSRLYVKNERLVSISEGVHRWQISIYPSVASGVKATAGSLQVSRLGDFELIEVEVPVYRPSIEVHPVSNNHALVKVDPDWPKQVGDVFLQIDYSGDVAAAYLKGELLTDHIHYGQVWPIGLKQFRHELESEALMLSITPIRKGTVETFVDQALVERFQGREIAAFNRIEAVPHYEVALYRKFE